MDQIVHYSQSLGGLEAVGVFGFFMYISAFAAVQWRLLNGNSITYSVANVMSSVFVSISLIAEFNLSAALIQGSVIIIGVTGLILRLRRAPSSTHQILTPAIDTKPT